MMEKVLTIVIPAYNVKSYLRKCLDSFIIEEIMDDMEVIIVDDGSTDDTLQIAQEYETKYSNVFRTVHKENGGHGSTINVGIELARGKYFKVVDGDDWVKQDGLTRLLNFLKKANSDVVVSHYTWISHDTEKVMKHHNTLLKGLDYETEYDFSGIAEKIYIRMHELTVKTSILQENNIKIDEHCFYVDQEFVNYPSLYWNTIAFVDAEVYQYRLGLNGQSMSKSSMQKNVKQHEHVMWQLMKYYQMAKNEGEPEWRCRYLARSASYMVASQIKIYLSFEKSKEMQQKIMELDREVEKEYPEVYENVKNIAVWLLRKTNYMLYPLAVWLLHIIWK